MDKRITRLANSGATSVIMFGKSWELSPGTWGVRVPTKRNPGVKPEVYKIDDALYVNPAHVGGMCIRAEDYLSTRMVR